MPDKCQFISQHKEEWKNASEPTSFHAFVEGCKRLRSRKKFFLFNYGFDESLVQEINKAWSPDLRPTDCCLSFRTYTIVKKGAIALGSQSQSALSSFLASVAFKVWGLHCGQQKAVRFNDWTG